MVILGQVEFVEGSHLRHDRTIPDVLAIQLVDDFLRDRLLLIVMIKDRRAVLRARVVTLAVERGRVVDHEEHIQDFLEGDDLRVERYLHHLGVTGRPGAHLLVARVGHLSARITRFNRYHALQFVVHSLQAPETTTGQRCHLRLVTHKVFSFLLNSMHQ